RALKCDSVDLAFVDEKEALTRGSAADVRHEGDRSIVVHGRRLERRESPAPRSRRTLEHDSRHRALVDEEYPLTRSSAADVGHEGYRSVVVQRSRLECRESPASRRGGALEYRSGDRERAGAGQKAGEGERAEDRNQRPSHPGNPGFSSNDSSQPRIDHLRYLQAFRTELLSDRADYLMSSAGLVNSTIGEGSMSI